MARSGTLLLAGLLALGWVGGCSSEEDHPAKRGFGGASGATSPGVAGAESVVSGPCAEGAVHACSTDLGTYNGVHSCFVGCQYCESGDWGACVDCVDGGVAGGAGGNGGNAAIELDAG